jgi:hypothetical protein
MRYGALIEVLKHSRPNPDGDGMILDLSKLIPADLTKEPYKSIMAKHLKEMRDEMDKAILAELDRKIKNGEI